MLKNRSRAAQSIDFRPAPRPVQPVPLVPPAPGTAAPVQVQITDVQHNYTFEPHGLGMNIVVTYSVVGYHGRSSQFAVHFYYLDGTPVASLSDQFTDAAGSAVTGTGEFQFQGDPQNYVFSMFMPYSALDIPFGELRGNVYEQRRTDLDLYVDLSIDNAHAVRGGPWRVYVSR